MNQLQIYTATLQIAIRLLVSLVLLLAAISKLQVAPAILRGESLLSNQWLLYTAIIVEFAIATFALVAPSRSAWGAITALFLTLTVFATWAIFANLECNCFGNLLPTGTSLPINIVVVSVMLVSRKHWGIGQENCIGPSVANDSRNKEQKYVNLSFRLAVAVVASLVAATVSGLALNNSLKSQKDLPDIRFLLADDWIGKSWPLDENFDVELKDLTVGNWLVLVFRSDCDHCKALAKRIDDQKNDETAEKPKIVSLVAGSNDWAVHFGRASTSLESQRKVHWKGREEPFVASPAAFLLEDGKVVDAKDGENADSLVQRVLELP